MFNKREQQTALSICKLDSIESITVINSEESKELKLISVVCTEICSLYHIVFKFHSLVAVVQ